MRILPILFNTGMVRAILDGRKTVTRRVIKGFIPDQLTQWGYTAFTPKGNISCRGVYGDKYGEKFFKLPYNRGDILYVRETWAKLFGRIVYKADYKEVTTGYWRPSIHMPKEAARIFLRVTDVRVERLQEIKNDGCVAEGAVQKPNYTKRGDLVLHNRYRKEFAELWDSTIKPADRDRYGWEANPWVWVIEFERCEKPRTLLKNGRI